MLCNYGLVGFCFFHIPFIICFTSILRIKDKKQIMLSIALLLFYIVCMFSVSLEGQKIYSYTIGLITANICESKDLLSINRIGRKAINENS